MAYNDILNCPYNRVPIIGTAVVSVDNWNRSGKRRSDCCLKTREQLLQLKHDEKKLFFNEMMTIPVLYLTNHIAQLDFYNASSLKQQATQTHYSDSQPTVFALTP